jgi:hypothetical protein
VDSLGKDVVTHVNVQLHIVTRVLLTMHGSAPINWAWHQIMLIFDVKAVLMRVGELLHWATTGANAGGYGP